MNLSLPSLSVHRRGHNPHWLKVLLIAGFATYCTVAAATVPPGPAGLAFYTPPTPLPAGQHGDLIWARPLGNSAAALPAAAANWLVLYQSENIAGHPTAVSGTVAVPTGTPPAGGWPVISWTHGTTGVADACAPSRDSANGPVHGYVGMMNKVLNTWVKRGYAVVKTDYQGLGTPGVHPYLVGNMEAFNATDIVVAARQLVPTLSTNWVVMGHSQGGGAAIYTSYIAPMYEQGISLKAAVSLAPASYVSEQMQYMETHLNQLPATGFSFAALLLNSMAVSAPGVKLNQLLTAEGQRVNRVALTGCDSTIARYVTDHHIRKLSALINAKADFAPLNTAMKVLTDTQNVTPAVPLLVVQADNDREIRAQFTTRMVDGFRVLGIPVTYKLLHASADNTLSAAHRATVTDSLHYVMKWVNGYLPPPTEHN